MSRPRSILGLVFYLISLHVRRRPLLLVVALAIVGVFAITKSESAKQGPRTTPIQAAILKDGFAVMENGDDRHVIELDRDGARRRRSAVPIAADTRIVGAGAGPLVGWLENKQFQIALVKGDGVIERGKPWGKKVHLLCDGVASNDERFGFGYVEDEKEGRMWLIHGPTTGKKAASLDETDALEAIAAPNQISWCAVRSAGPDISLFWRLGDRLFMNLCSKRDCASLVSAVKIDPRWDLHDIACHKKSCLVAARDHAGTVQFGAITLLGKNEWSKKLPHATASTRVKLTAAGDNAFAMAFETNEGVVVERVLAKNGSIARAWQHTDVSVPAIAWSQNQLALGFWHEATLLTTLVAMPR